MEERQRQEGGQECRDRRKGRGAGTAGRARVQGQEGGQLLNALLQV